jgi:hypothetical protein
MLHTEYAGRQVWASDRGWQGCEMALYGTRHFLEEFIFTHGARGHAVDQLGQLSYPGGTEHANEATNASVY